MKQFKKSKQFTFAFDLDDPYHLRVLEALCNLPRGDRVEALCNMIRSFCGDDADVEAIHAKLKRLVYKPINISDASVTSIKIAGHEEDAALEDKDLPAMKLKALSV